MTFEQSVDVGVKVRAIKIDQAVVKAVLLILIRDYLRRHGPSCTTDVCVGIGGVERRQYHFFSDVLARYCVRMGVVEHPITKHRNVLWSLPRTEVANVRHPDREVPVFSGDDTGDRDGKAAVLLQQHLAAARAR